MTNMNDGAVGEEQPTIYWSKDAKARAAADNVEYNIWEDYDVDIVYNWLYEAETRIPNRTNTRGGCLHKLINTLYNSCEYVHQEIERNPNFKEEFEANTKKQARIDLYRKYMATLALRVLDRLEESEAAQANDSDEFDEDDY